MPYGFYLTSLWALLELGGMVASESSHLHKNTQLAFIPINFKLCGKKLSFSCGATRLHPCISSVSRPCDWFPTCYLCDAPQVSVFFCCLISTRPHTHMHFAAMLLLNITCVTHFAPSFIVLFMNFDPTESPSGPFQSNQTWEQILNRCGYWLNNRSSPVTGRGCMHPLLSATWIIHLDVWIPLLRWAAPCHLPLCMYGRDKEVNYRREVPWGGWRSRAERGNPGSTMCPTITISDKQTRRVWWWNQGWWDVINPER